MRAAILAALAILTACTPVRSRLPPPYPIGDLEVDAEQLEAIARSACEARSRVLPKHAFTTDGCSAWPDSAWRACCIEHDTQYWCGGSTADRRAADREFRSCVAERSNAFNAWLMHLGVRVGGPRLSPWPWRWGYGHDWPYREEEQANFTQGAE